LIRHTPLLRFAADIIGGGFIAATLRARALLPALYLRCRLARRCYAGSVIAFRRLIFFDAYADITRVCHASWFCR